jgi:hypothetical protein
MSELKFVGSIDSRIKKPNQQLTANHFQLIKLSFRPKLRNLSTARNLILFLNQ